MNFNCGVFILSNNLENEVGGENYKVLYEVDATNLKDSDKHRRWLRSAAFISIYLVIVYILYFFIFELSLIVLLAIMFFTPSWYIPSLAVYKITDKGIVDDKEHIIPIHSKYKFIANEERKFVTIKKGRRELFMIYTPEPMYVMRLLESLSKSLKS